MNRLQSIFSTMLGVKKTYLKIRLLSASGLELIVVRRESNKVVRLEKNELQNKTHRSYVKNTINLPIGSVYISEINLNREHGKVSIPYQEILRTATPIYDEESQKIAGLILIA